MSRILVYDRDEAQFHLILVPDFMVYHCTTAARRHNCYARVLNDIEWHGPVASVTNYCA